jgi:3-methylfumaryl-CoA hydratase
VAAQRELGADGHPKLGTFLPPVTLPRRMFAGGNLSFSSKPLCVGEQIKRQGVVGDVKEKSGKSGELVFVNVNYQIKGTNGEVFERQDLVYRSASNPSAASATNQPQPSKIDNSTFSVDDARWTWGIDLTVSPTLLFRFSALTYNAHRIHYDYEYATKVEGYPGLVVHGPLQAIGLAEIVRRFLPEKRIASFSFRALQPAFSDSPLSLRGRRSEKVGELLLEAFSAQEVATMSATATLAD